MLSSNIPRILVNVGCAWGCGLTILLLFIPDLSTWEKGHPYRIKVGLGFEKASGKTAEAFDRRSTSMPQITSALTVPTLNVAVLEHGLQGRLHQECGFVTWDGALILVGGFNTTREIVAQGIPDVRRALEGSSSVTIFNMTDLSVKAGKTSTIQFKSFYTIL